MQAELNSDVALNAANALLSHLRKNPDAAMQPARDLASKFDLDESFVSQVLQGIQASRRPEARPIQARKSVLKSIGLGVLRAWTRMTARPVLFVGVSFVICYALIWAAGSLVPMALQGSRPDVASIWTILSVFGIGGFTLGLQMTVYFCHRSSRNALWGALLLFVSMLAFLSYGMIRGHARSSGIDSPVLLFLVGTMAMLMVSLLYAGFGSLASILGAWARIK